jgi:micrococcal nuclease
MARRRSWKWSIPGIVLVALLAAFFNPSDQSTTHGDFEVVERVVDGDTLLLQSGERVRLIGVDTPEIKHPKKPIERFGKEASEFTCQMVEGKRVRLELDPANAPTGHKDNTQQKRTLAYVFLDDGRLLNAEIIKQGYGFALSRYPIRKDGRVPPLGA